MKPSYEEIIILDPGLMARSKNEVEELMDTIVSKGYFWNEKNKIFYNKELNLSVRTAGLDLFYPDSFIEVFQGWSNAAKKFNADRLREPYWLSSLFFNIGIFTGIYAVIDLFVSGFIAFIIGIIIALVLELIGLLIQKQFNKIKFFNEVKKTSMNNSKDIYE